MGKGRFAKFAVFVSVACFVAAACSTVPYQKTFRYWTQKENIYSVETLAAKILWHATYLSPEYRSTARAKVNEWKKLEPDEMGSYASYLMEVDEGSFMVSIYTPRGYPKFPEITVDADSFWEFTLDLPTGESYMPTSIESVTITPRETRLFPYVNRWSKFYKVKFPVYGLSRPFRLSLRSAGVTSTLEWK